MSNGSASQVGDARAEVAGGVYGCRRGLFRTQTCGVDVDVPSTPTVKSSCVKAHLVASCPEGCCQEPSTPVEKLEMPARVAELKRKELSLDCAVPPKGGVCMPPPYTAEVAGRVL